MLTVLAAALLATPGTLGAAEDIQTCGEISIYREPPETQRLYRAFFHQIDGRNVDRERHTYKLAPGGYEIALHELITDPWLRRTPTIQKAKIFLLNVERGVRYDFAAKFIVEKRMERRDEGYWEPVVWRMSEIECKGRVDRSPQ
jgi:hypothetical protein